MVGTFLLSLLTACSGGGASGDASQVTVVTTESSGIGKDDVPVASLVLRAPSIDTFIVRANLPVPPGKFPRKDGLQPYTIADQNGQAFRTQVEVVSRYPDSEQDGADVVQLLARVRLPEGMEAGDRLNLRVYEATQPAGPISAPGDVRDLISNPNPIVLRATDVFGNVYVAEVLESEGPRKVLRNGVAVLEWRTHSTLLPVAPNATTLPHLMGVHAYFRVHAGEPILQMDLRVHNGHSGINRTDPTDDPLDVVYFEKLELVVPGGWEVTPSFDSPFAGPTTTQLGQTAVYPLVRANADGKMHVMPRHGQFMRRLTIAKPEDVEIARSYAVEEGLAFCQPGDNSNDEERYSWWNRHTARYYPQSHPLPRLDHVGLPQVAEALENEFGFLSDILANGLSDNYPILAGSLGWAHPWGIDHGGQTGGNEIFLYSGIKTAASASRHGYRSFQIRHRMYTERHPMALIDQGGEPSSYLDWIVPNGLNGPWLPIWCFLTPLTHITDPFGFEDAPSFHVEHVQANGLQPDYEGELFSYKAIDLEHLVRYTNPAKVLVWLGNDALAKDSLRMQAECFRMGYNDLPNSEYEHTISTGMLRDLNWVEANPGIGLPFGRLEGWGIDAVASYYAVAPVEWRETVRPWFDMAVGVVERGQSQCTGIIQSSVYGTFFDGQYRAMQSIEQAITENALWGVMNTVYAGLDNERFYDVKGVLERTTLSMVSAPAWSPEFGGPHARLAIGELDIAIPPFCQNVPPDGFTQWADTYQTWSSLAYGYELTGDPLFLQRADEMAGGPALEILTADGLDNLENKAALLALLQQLP